MSEISNKKKKFIKRNFKQLSIDELARKTGLTPKVIRSLIDQYSTEMPGKEQPAQENRAGIFISWRIILFTFLLFAAVTYIIYSPSLHGDFVFDDLHFIYDDPLTHISKLSQLTDLLFSKVLVRRIGIMSFALNHYFGGLNPVGFHHVNVIIHILNGLFLFLLSYTILTLPCDEGKGRGNAFKISFLGSLLWLVHPIQTQAVAYIYQRLSSLAALFFLLSLLCYFKGRVHTTLKRFIFFILSTLFGLLALGTKQNTATLPLFIILSEFFFFQSRTVKIDRKKLVPIILLGGSFILIAGIYLAYDLYPSLFDHRLTPLESGLTQLRVVIFYLSLLFYPHPSRLNIDHDFSISHSLFFPFTTFLSLLVIIGLIALTIFLIKRNRLVSYALIWFFGNMVIESSIIPLELVFEHRLYLPSMGLSILFLGFCVNLPKSEWKKWVTAFTILLLPIFSYWTYERASVWREPLSLWMDAAKKSPHKARPHNGLGIAYEKGDRLDEAISEYKQALAINPYLAKAHNNLGITYRKKGRLDEAISECRKALAINPNDAGTHTNLGLVYAQKGRLDEAISEHRKALAINPHLAEVHNNLGLVYVQKGGLDEAISEYRKALAINPHLAEAHYNLGKAYTKKDRLDEAIAEYEQALAINPRYLEALNHLGMVYIRKGRLDTAISLYEKALSINPNFAKTHYNLGNAYLKKGESDKSISEYKRAIDIKPDYFKAHTNLGTIYKEKGRLDAAISQFKKALAVKPNFADTHYNLGILYNQKGRLDVAISQFKKALAVKPNFADAHYNLGTLYNKKGKQDEAISQFKQALVVKPNYVLAHYNLGIAYKDKGRLDEAISQYQKTLSINPNHLRARVSLGSAYSRKKMFDQAIAEHRKALAIRPNYLLAHYNLGNAYRNKGEWDKAISQYKKALEIKPDFAEAQYNLELVEGKKRKIR